MQREIRSTHSPCLRGGWRLSPFPDQSISRSRIKITMLLRFGRAIQSGEPCGCASTALRLNHWVRCVSSSGEVWKSWGGFEHSQCRLIALGSEDGVCLWCRYVHQKARLASYGREVLGLVVVFVAWSDVVLLKRLGIDTARSAADGPDIPEPADLADPAGSTRGDVNAQLAVQELV